MTRWFDCCASTNSLIASDKERLDEFSCYAAVKQTDGRGQKGNIWSSAPGLNLTFSLLLRPTFLPTIQQFSISQVVTIGILDYLEEKGIHARVKWPNDIYVKERKICGVLIENSLSSGKLSVSIAGIGLNVNQVSFDTSIPNPTSMKQETGLEYDISSELPLLNGYIRSRYEEIRSPYTRNGVDALYISKMYRRGEWHSFEEMSANDIPTEKRSGSRFTARILGIDPEACLLLELSDGTVRHFSFKEIKYII